MSEELYAAAKGRVEEVLQQVNGGVGEDISYDELFEAIKEETDKLSGLDGSACDWSAVAVNAEELLTDKSKDFRVGCYWATTKLREGTLESALDALVFLKELTETYWDDMYPPLRRIRARAGMAGWMAENGGEPLMEVKLKPADREMITTIDTVRKELQALWQEKFGDQYPSMAKVNDAVRHLDRTCPKEKPKAEPKPPAPVAQTTTGAAPPTAPPAAGASGGAGLGVEIVDAASVMKALEPLSRLLIQLARTLRAEKPENMLSYRFMRQGAWMELAQAPPTPNDGKSLVPPPPVAIKQRFDALAASDDWLTLLNEAEQQGSEYILWLDPHRYTAMAMDRLGALFLKAKKELLMQVALLLQRIPTMPQVPFNDGTGFADGATQMWIENEVLPVFGGEGGGGGGGGGGGPSVLDEPIKEAKGLATKGELGKAVNLIAEAAAAAPSPAERFRGKLAVAQLCLGGGEFAIARGQLEGLALMIQQHNLQTGISKSYFKLVFQIGISQWHFRFAFQIGI